ncbi:aldose 1-epimerase [Flavobacterium nitrogenifigens]|uniref:Aldose 1-epimerase n=2 Tax=Flavobacterium TaxID=237 RepID=A0A7W7IXC8_9FLAO|nr:MULTISPECIES: aldose epimerase family protein [Flavobacterium]MBB4802349.1 aldose 1-epimerase [Flavobacterium nitrogenifigens]MBB6387307.1 aldose 1-epimerase [Flavobacterium notoginsengisoli]
MNKFQLSISLSFLMLFGLTENILAQNKNSAKKESIKKEMIGQVGGEDVFQYTLQNKTGMQVQLITYGAAITNIVTPDKDGKMSSVVLGFDSLSQYASNDNSLMGSTVGRVANRISDKKFTLDGKEFTLSSDIHGGVNGFDKRVWKAREISKKNDPAVEMTYLSKDGEEGFPGNLSVSVTFTLKNNNDLVIDYKATTDKATPLVLTNHTYFNLSGGKETKALNTELTVFADQFLEFKDGSMPTGKILNVKQTPFDFTSPKMIGKEIEKVQQYTNGYDVTFVLRNQTGKLSLAAKAYEPLSGRELEVYTTEPGVVFYSGNWLSEKVKGRNNVPYTKNGAFCLETMHYPNSINTPAFPNTVLRPNEIFTSQTIYKFLVRK